MSLEILGITFGEAEEPQIHDFKKRAISGGVKPGSGDFASVDYLLRQLDV
jgi:hypothetical protein